MAATFCGGWFCCCGSGVATFWLREVFKSAACCSHAGRKLPVEAAKEDVSGFVKIRDGCHGYPETNIMKARAA